MSKQESQKESRAMIARRFRSRSDFVQEQELIQGTRSRGLIKSIRACSATMSRGQEVLSREEHAVNESMQAFNGGLLCTVQGILEIDFVLSGKFMAVKLGPIACFRN